MKHPIANLVLTALLLSIISISGFAQNIALNRPVTVSSVQSGTSNTGNLAVDGNSSTRWSSASSDPQWIYVDLGSQYNITNVSITWETAYGKDYRIDVSNDASTWTTIKTITSNTSLTNTNSVTGTGRYVRIYGTARGTVYGYSIYELVVNGSVVTTTQSGTNLALNRPVTVSSVQSGTSNTGNLAVDGNSSTRWSSASSDPQWIYVDLGSQYNITTVNITWETAYGKDYRIDVSNDASTWTTIKSITGNTSLTNTNSVTGTGRYVRIYGTARGTVYGYSIYELVVNGSAVTTTQSGTNLALNRPVTVSSVQTGTSNTGNLAVDGNSSTRWASSFSDPQWIYVDLGSQYNITNVNITWESGYGKNYTIDVSNDAITWTTIKTITSNTSLTNANSVTGTGRYVRIYGTVRGTVYGYSIYELVVNGSATTTTTTTTTTPPPPPPSGGSGGLTTTTGKTYYFSTTDGDDSRTSTQAQSSSTPWKTLSKLNSFFSSLQPGDLVLFKRGDTFYGSINITKSGSSGLPISFSAYGTGAKPVISGFATIPSWTSIGNGLYEAVLSAGLPTLNMVTLDGAFEVMGKYPKGNTGYFTVSSASGTTSLSSTGISGIPSFVGGEVVWRAYHWVLWRGAVTAQSSTSVTFSPFPSTLGGPVYPAQANYGFFFQNHPNACTALGEWAYNPGTHKITIYFGTGGPGTHVVKASSIENLINVSGRSYITFDNIAVAGANTESFIIINSNNIKMNACDISFSGHDAVNANGGCANMAITNSNISYTNYNAIMCGSSPAWTITGNTISNTGAVTGMGGSGEGQYNAIMNVKDGSVVSLNKITNTGYMPISFQGINNTIQNNFIDTYCFIKDDGAGIYCGGENFSGTRVINNIVLNGIGARAGTPPADDGRTHGIYVDNGGSNVEIGGNTVAFNQYSGIYSHNSYALNIHDNTAFDNGFTGIKYYNSANSVANITLTNNIFFAKTASEFVSHSSGGTNSPATFFSTANNNYWCRPLNESNSFQIFAPVVGSYNLAGWRTLTGKETNSKTTPIAVTTVNNIRFEYNASSSSKAVSLGATYMDVKGTTYASTITLAPYTSAVLLYMSGTTQAVANTTEVVDANTLNPLKPSFVLYPNPVTNNFSIELTNSQTGKMNVQITNVSGQIIRSLMLNKDLQTTQFSVPASDLPKGVYFVQVHVGSWSDTKRFVKL